MRERICLCYDWDFTSKKGATLRKAKGGNFIEKVCLPHTPRIEALDSNRTFKGKVWYRRTLNIEEADRGKVLTLIFDGVMMQCAVYLNGKYIGGHKGGYLPFSFDIGRYVKYGEDNTLSVCVDNRDDENIAPGRPESKLDFLYYGGIYRDVWLEKSDRVHITNPLLSKSVLSGINIYEKEGESGVMTIQAQAINSDKTSHAVALKAFMIDAEGEIVDEKLTDIVELSKGATVLLTLETETGALNLWSPENPYLYTFELQLIKDGEIIDSRSYKRGFRSFEVDEEGFKLNKKPYLLRGTNRHQQYPYIGIAASDNAQFRDAYKLKEAGFNLVRMSHYPQSEAFLDACDELGLIAIQCVPGWQYCKTGEFQDSVSDAITCMVRRDRNRTCVGMWETSLNETGRWCSGASDRFFIECKNIVYKQMPYAKPLVSGDTIGRKNPIKVGYDVPYSEHKDIEKSRHLNSIPDKKCLVREYGDFEFGGDCSVSRVGRGDGEGCMLLQAWNFQWSHNRNLNTPCVLGDATWEGIDHVRGMNDETPISKSGVLDIFRLPKYSYYFFRTQDRRIGREEVYIPSYWQDERIDTLPIFSNCDKVRLYINGKLIGEKECDKGGVSEYTLQTNEQIKERIKKKSSACLHPYPLVNPNDYSSLIKGSPIIAHMIDTMYRGNDANKLASAPFTFKDIKYEAGEVRAEGIIDSKVVCEHVVKTPQKPTKVVLKVDYSGQALNADGRDFVFVHALICDNNGTIVPLNGVEVTFKVENGIIIPNNCVQTEAGIASVLIKSEYNAEKVIVSAVSDGLKGERRGLALD